MMGGTIYIAHFAEKIGDPSRPRMHAQHYLGFAEPWHFEARIQQHLDGRGARITKFVADKGIGMSFFVIKKGVLLSDIVDNSDRPVRPDSCSFSRRSGTNDHPMPANLVRRGISWVIVGHRAPTSRLSGAKWLRRQRQRQEIAHPPAPACQSSGHGRCPLAIPPRLALPTTIYGVRQHLPERLMRPYEVIIRPPPVQMKQQLRRLLHRRQVRRINAATLCRTVRLTRSTKAVVSLPLKPSLVSATRSASRVPQRTR